MDTREFAPFDAAAYLDSEEMIAEYLGVAANDPDPDMLLPAIANVARARGMESLAQRAGIGRESLFKALSPGSNPGYKTVAKILAALNMEMKILPAQPEK